MPEIIMIEQNQDIINYINMLNLPYSAIIKNHMVNMVSGIITLEGNKNVSAIYKDINCNRDISCGSRFLGEYKWNCDYVDHKRILHSTKEIRKKVDDETVGFLIIDDTLSEKDTSTKSIEGLEFHRSHSKNKAVWSHCVVSSHYKVPDYSLPLNLKLYLRKQFFGKRAKKYFKNKQQLAIELIDEFLPVTDTTYLLIDAWYTAGKITLHALSNGYHTKCHYTI